LCQDGGVTIVFAEIGQDVHIVGGSFEEAVNAGIQKGYQSAHLRGSILDSPFHGKNTGFNAPGVIHTKLTMGDDLRIRVMPKGGGADNMSQLKMLVPAAGVEGIRTFVLDVVEQAGPNACPPLIVGVGIGGTFDSVAQLAKHALLRAVGEPNPDAEIAKFEAELLTDINKLGIGPMGLGGTTTAIAVHVETHPLHMASLPVAVNLQCHSARVQTAVL
jgi:fumarate hydratase subunit alpha